MPQTGDFQSLMDNQTQIVPFCDFVSILFESFSHTISKEETESSFLLKSAGTGKYKWSQQLMAVSFP